MNYWSKKYSKKLCFHYLFLSLFEMSIVSEDYNCVFLISYIEIANFNHNILWLRKLNCKVLFILTPFHYLLKFYIFLFRLLVIFIWNLFKRQCIQVLWSWWVSIKVCIIIICKHGLEYSVCKADFICFIVNNKDSDWRKLEDWS
jgi:hypothetical protein